MSIRRLSDAISCAAHLSTLNPTAPVLFLSAMVINGEAKSNEEDSVIPPLLKSMGFWYAG